MYHIMENQIVPRGVLNRGAAIKPNGSANSQTKALLLEILLQCNFIRTGWNIFRIAVLVDPHMQKRKITILPESIVNNVIFPGRSTLFIVKSMLYVST